MRRLGRPGPILAGLAALVLAGPASHTLAFAAPYFCPTDGCSRGEASFTPDVQLPELGPKEPVARSRFPETTGLQIRVLRIAYVSHDGLARRAYVATPAWYHPLRDRPLPLVISPHGRGIAARTNLRLWGDLPAIGGFAVVSPEGQGRSLTLDSWGYPGQIDDLARMPDIVRSTLPWLRIDPRRIYAFGGSMGGQETLLLLARHPRLLAGVAAFDSVTDLALQYRNLRHLGCRGACRRKWGEPIGRGLRTLISTEVGGLPSSDPRAYRLRSPYSYARTIASSGVPLELWWSVADTIVRDQADQSGRLFWTIRKTNPADPVAAFAGNWVHTHEMSADTRLPLALSLLGLLPARYRRLPPGLHVCMRTCQELVPRQFIPEPRVPSPRFRQSATD